jgi:putative transposase
MIALDDRLRALGLVREAVASGAKASKACAILGLSERTVARWSKERIVGDLADKRPSAERPEPANKLGPKEREAIVEAACKPEFADCAPSQIVPRLADQGVYIASESSFYRVLKSRQLDAPRRARGCPALLSKPRRHVAESIGEVWVWDITWMKGPIAGQWYYLYAFMDLYSRKIIGWEVFDEQTAECASVVLEKTRWAEGDLRKPLVLHSDNGTPMKGLTMIAKMQSLGVAPSLSRPGVSDDNAQIESFFKTLKYRPSYPAGASGCFESLEKAREWCSGFMKWYNEEHKHSSIGYCSPGQRHAGEDHGVLARRREVYAEHKKANPKRWGGREPREWLRPGAQSLNPDNKEKPA